MIIYKVTNKIDGKMYVGQTVQTLKDRWKDHVRGDKGSESYLHRAVAKYGADNFIVETIDTASTLEGLNVLEIHYITALGTLAPNGYNLELGGNNKECHPDTRAKISATLKGRAIPNRWDKGFTGAHTDETKARISQKLKGRPIANRWTKGNSTPMKEETKAKLSAAIKGKPQAAKHKPVQIKETGAIYASVATAAQAVGLHRTQVSELLKSGRQNKKTGFTFLYAKKVD